MITTSSSSVGPHPFLAARHVWAGLRVGTPLDAHSPASALATARFPLRPDYPFPVPSLFALPHASRMLPRRAVRGADMRTSRRSGRGPYGSRAEKQPAERPGDVVEGGAAKGTR